MGNAADLSDDDIVGIFRLLPFSSLVRAGLVCNRWRRLALVADSKQHSSWCILSCPAKRRPPTTECRVRDWLSRSGCSCISKPSLSRCGSSGRGPRLARSLSLGSGRGRSFFGSARKQPPSTESTDNYHVVMFDPFSRKWLKVANPFGYTSEGPFGSPSKELLWVPSTGGYSGLVCVVEWEEESRHRFNVYWVGNPITNKWKYIVGPSPWRGVHQLVVNPITKSYKIISIRWERQNPADDLGTGVWRVAIYDSELEKWRTGASFTVPDPPSGTPARAYSLSSRTHTASDKMMYLLMYRAGKLMTWETYTEIRIVGYDIDNDEFKFITPLCQFDLCLDYFEPTSPSCRDWPVHLVLKSEQLSSTDDAEGTPNPAHPACPQLVTCSAVLEERPRYSFKRIFRKISNIIQCRPSEYHKEFINKICILEFNPDTASWEVKEESSIKVFGKFYTKDRVFHCAGDRLDYLYCAHLDEHQSVLVWNAEKDNISTWSRLPPLGEQYGGFIAKNYHSLGSFVPRIDARP